MNTRVYNVLRKHGSEEDPYAHINRIALLGQRGEAHVNPMLAKLLIYGGKVSEQDERNFESALEDIKHEADTKGLNWGSAGSYGASALAAGGLGRLIAGKEHAGWGWGGGILAGLLANYARRKTYYGKNITV